MLRQKYFRKNVVRENVFELIEIHLREKMIIGNSFSRGKVLRDDVFEGK